MRAHLNAWVGLALALVQGSASSPTTAREEAIAGTWQAWLDSPGGALAFGLELAREDGALRAHLVNGRERIDVPQVRFENAQLALELAHYDSRVEAKADLEGGRLDGTWAKRSGPERWTKLAFHALRSKAPAAGANDAGQSGARELQGRWAVRFASSEDPAVGVFEAADEPDGLTGTFLTTLGDYRYLSGRFDRARGALVLSCFDGAHAFLFVAQRKGNDALEGEFFSGDAWHERWSAKRDPAAALPDPFSLTHWSERGSLAELEFPDLDGRVRSLGDPAFAGKARVVQVFGSWCPNCNDEAPYLAELDRRYRARGLSIVGLAFEVTGDPERDARQVRLYGKRHGIEFPLLVAGVSDKEQASRKLPFLDALRAYPTTIFLDASGKVRAVHTGYAGPATGPEHLKLREDFERTIEGLLDEQPGAQR